MQHSKHSKQQIFTIRTADGFIFDIPAGSRDEARTKIRTPKFALNVATMLQQSFQQVDRIEPNYKPRSSNPYFGDEFFQ